ncbi:MAG: T9SS type A sorting domain-containing protein, partial [Candidatus Latescibacteria bacterium]|nr:T9SS type A sorting domain-containing protein [Candidatus Latescibacterota bacterium]
FAGEAVEGHVVLNWATASQTNNAGFRVLRSTDQENFEVVSDLIAGAGTTDALVDYSFTDAIIPAAEQVYYVLEQIDLDGTIHRSNPIEVLLGARFLNLPTEFASAVYPNPFNPSTTISYDLPAEADVSIVIYDAIGQEIRQLVSQQHTAGRYSIQWDAKDHLGRSVGSGVYIAKILAGQNSVTQKMLLLK